MAFDQNPTKFDLKYTIEDGDVVFHESSIDLLYWLDDDHEPEERPVLLVTEAFRQNGVELLEPRLWRFSQVKRSGQAGFVTLTFDGNEFTAQLKHAKRTEATRMEQERLQSAAGEDPSKDQPRRLPKALSLFHAIVDGDRIQLYVREWDDPKRTQERKKRCEYDRIAALNLDLRYVKSRHHASQKKSEDSGAKLADAPTLVAPEFPDSSIGSKRRTADGSGRL